jgi:hypothetical protein
VRQHDVIGRSQRARDESRLPDFPFKKRSLSHANTGTRVSEEYADDAREGKNAQPVSLEFKL